MKRKLYAIIVLMFCLCQLVNANKGETGCEIKGEITNFKGGTISVNNKKVKVNAHGKFYYSFSLKKPAFIKINYGKKLVLYVAPGKKIRLGMDVSKDVSSTNVSGDLLEINKYMIKNDFHQQVKKFFRSNKPKLMSLNGQQYTDEIYLFFKPFFKGLDRFPAPDDISKDFKKFYKVLLQYSRANLLIKYADYYRWHHKLHTYQPAKGYYNFLKKINIDDPILLEVHESRRFLNNLIDFETEKRFNKDSKKVFNYFRAKLITVLKIFKNETIRDEFLYSIMTGLLGEYYQKGMDDLLKLVEKNLGNKKYLAKIQSLVLEEEKEKKTAMIKVYKRIGDLNLDVFIYLPENFKKSDQRSAVAFFHGGGWRIGSPLWGAGQCEHFAAKGMVAMAFEFRIIGKHGTTPVESIRDAKSAIRWMRKHSSEYGIDVNRIAASGFSSGGHIAACTAIAEKFDEQQEDQSVSSKPNALILWVAPVNIEHEGWVMPKLRDRATVLSCSPNHGAKAGLPPTIMFQGTNDHLVPYKYSKKFAQKMLGFNNRCDLHLYEGQGHFGWSRKNLKDIYTKMDDFLISIGF